MKQKVFFLVFFLLNAVISIRQNEIIITKNLMRQITFFVVEIKKQHNKRA